MRSNPLRISRLEVAVLCTVLGLCLYFVYSSTQTDAPSPEVVEDSTEIASVSPKQDLTRVQQEESSPQEEARGVNSGTASIPAKELVVDNTGKHHVTLRSDASEASYVLNEPLTDTQLSEVVAMGGRVTPSVSGRTGPVVRFSVGDEAQNPADFLQALTSIGLVPAGQLLEFRMKTTHAHDMCGSCLVANAGAVAQLDGVVGVPRFLGDSAGEEVDVLIQPGSVSPEDVIRALEVDHSQILQ